MLELSPEAIDAAALFVAGHSDNPMDPTLPSKCHEHFRPGHMRRGDARRFPL
jgi:hypothetical protein